MELVFCMQCGQKIPSSAQNCPHCGAQQTQTAASISVPPQAASLPASILPEGVKGWSWGAFWFSWIWAIFNKTWIGLLALIPLVNLVMMVILGLKGREWAWRNKAWSSVEHFNRVQRKWSIAGWIVMAVGLLFGIAVGVIEDRMKHSAADDFNTNWSLDADSNKKSDVQHTDAPPQSTRYPMPRLTFLKSDLIGAMKRMGIEQHWISYFTDYLNQPKDFWQTCVAHQSERAKFFGGMGQQEAQAYGEDSCQSLVKHHHACLNDKTLDDALMCLQGHINDVAENGD